MSLIGEVRFIGEQVNWLNAVNSRTFPLTQTN